MSGNDAEHFKLLVLKRIQEISDIICDERLLEDFGRIKDKVDWVRTRKIIKKEIFETLLENWYNMWEEECLVEKLETLKKLKEKSNKETIAWRPKTGDIEPQGNFLYKKKLLGRRDYLMKIALEKEEMVAKQKTQLLDKWKFYEETSQQIEKYQSENKLLCTEINEHLEKYINII